LQLKFNEYYLANSQENIGMQASCLIITSRHSILLLAKIRGRSSIAHRCTSLPRP